MLRFNDKSVIPRYDEIVSLHNALNLGYSLRPRKPVNYVEDEDANFDDASDEDYIDEEEEDKLVVASGRPKRNIPIVDYIFKGVEKTYIFSNKFNADNVPIISSVV